MKCWPMSAMGQKQTSDACLGMSALPPKADIGRMGCDVRFVPIADIARPLSVLGPVESPPWKRQRVFPGSARTRQLPPARVLAPAYILATPTPSRKTP